MLVNQISLSLFFFSAFILHILYRIVKVSFNQQTLSHQQQIMKSGRVKLADFYCYKTPQTHCHMTFRGFNKSSCTLCFY